MHAQPLVCFSPVKTSHLGLNSYENVSLVLYFQDVSAVTGTTCMHVQVLNVILSASWFTISTASHLHFALLHCWICYVVFPAALWENLLMRQWQAEFMCLFLQCSCTPVSLVTPHCPEWVITAFFWFFGTITVYWSMFKYINLQAVCHHTIFKNDYILIACIYNTEHYTPGWICCRLW